MELEQTSNCSLSPGHIVWAKLSSQPWWPAVVSSPPHPDRRHPPNRSRTSPNHPHRPPHSVSLSPQLPSARTPLSALRPFQTHKDRFRPKRGHRLKRAFELAERVTNGESNLQGKFLFLLERFATLRKPNFAR
jgi:hypothetical protein